MLGSMALWDSVAELPVKVDGYKLERRESSTPSGWTRVTTTVVLAGDGETGLGEDVTYESEMHDGVPDELMLAGTWSLEDFSHRLDDMEELLLPRRGTLWTFTTQQFIPKSPPYAIVETPETFQPYGVGYVEFDGLVKVEGRLTEPDVAKLEIGMEMEVVVVPFRTDDDGNQVTTFAFQPVG